MNITLVSCWYKIKSKFDEEIYKKWMLNFLNNVNYFYLVIFTNKESVKLLNNIIDKENTKIKIILKEYEEFITWKYKTKWITNHNNNNTLNFKSKWNTNWKLNMIWNEKISFVKHVKDNRIFNTEWYGWCDIGYFRNEHWRQLPKWPNSQKIKELNKSKIYYGLAGKRKDFINYIKLLVDKNKNKIYKTVIPFEQVSIAGGFFLIYKEKIDWWDNLYYNKLLEYFNNNLLVKDDQYIIIDCISNNLKEFNIIEEKKTNNKWFVFQNYLS